MDNERELLELAALACGIKLDYRHSSNDHYYDDPNTGWERWEPDFCDGQSARLRTKLYLCSSMTDFYARVNNGCLYAKDFAVPHDITEDSKNAALRMATLKCAAEIGRRMKEKHGEKS